MKCRCCGTELTHQAGDCPACGTLFPALGVDAFEQADPDRTPVSPRRPDPDLWRRIEEVFEAALEMTASWRAAYLAEVCGDDRELRREVEELLAADGEACGFLEPPADAESDAPPALPAALGDSKAAAPTVRHPRDDSVTEVGGGAPDLEISRFPPGTVLAERYRIVSLLGKGGMGEVYRADDLKLATTVALKFLPEAHERVPARTARFLGEVKIARRVSHPNVCRVFDVAEVDGHPFLSMEYVDGEDLSSLLRRIGRLPHDKAVEIGRETARGLAAVHREGILHRDLKPANLMIDGRGRARITDFGIAGLAASIQGAEVSVGTPAYMSPEQLAGEEVSVQSDLYALGLVLYELFTGERAYEAGSLDRMMLSKALPPRPPSRLVEDLEPAVERLILRCLEPDPRDRPSSAEAVAAALAAGGEGGVLKTLVASELVGVEGRGEDAGAMSRRHARIVRRLLDEHGGRETAGGDGLAVFERPIAAVGYALAYHRALAEWSRQAGRSLPEGGERKEIAARVAVHLGEVVLPEAAAAGGSLEAEGVARTTVERLLSLAVAGQTLLSRGAFDLARQSAGTDGGPDGRLRWLAHGAYTVDDSIESREIYEVGVEGEAPLAAPAESDRVRRVAGGETILGWRPAPGLELPDRRNWVMERELGEGGFGEVWLAAHCKTGERRVFKFCWEARSLKALQREITLFRLLKEELGERDDITRILDWNLEHAPYFIESEYTAGGSLVKWAEEQGGLEQVPVATRLELVAQVADALAAAHSVGVLHKDVKPGNVLITTDRDGQPRAQLTDFGVGLITDRERLARAGITVLGMTALDETGSSEAGTRLYMAPELVEGKAATVQADVYALGVMLYQLAVGDFTRALAPGWRREVKDELLRGDVAAAVEGSPERRLSDARRLAEQLRSLEGRREARQANLEQLQTRLEKLQEAEQAVAALARSRRRRRLLALAVALLALFGGAMAYQARRVASEAERAEREAAASRQVSEFLVELFELSDPYAASTGAPGADQVSARELLDRGAEKIEQELGDQPEIQARLMHTIGVVYRSLGLYEPATPLLENALVLRRQVHGDEHVDVAASLHDLAWLLQEKGDYATAEPLYRQALEMRRRLLGEEHREVAETLFDLGSLLIAKGDYEGAEPPTRQALAMQRRLLGDENRDVADSLNSLAFILERKGDLNTAESLLREALELWRRLLGNEHPDVANSMENLALLLASKGDYAGAEPLYRESLRILRRSLGEEHPEVANSLTSLAWLLQAKGDTGTAESMFRDALAMRRRLLGEEHPRVATSLSLLASCLRAGGDHEAAQPLYREALAMRRRLLGDQHPQVAWSQIGLAESLIETGNLPAAETRAREAVTIFTNALAAGHWQIANAESVLGEALADLGRYQEAERHLLSAFAILQSRTNDRSRYTQEALVRIVDLYEVWGQAEKAAEYRALAPE